MQIDLNYKWEFKKKKIFLKKVLCGSDYGVIETLLSVSYFIEC